ncbi:MAG: arginine--tRNA ligase, partial [Firmicutes bacterium]|nr:arginine--tRNA ligase [Bacillota bacterium]
MEKILDLISGKMADAFESAGFDRSYGRVTVSNRPDLCEYQCNGALAAAKVYHKAPIQIAQAVAEQLHHEDFESVAAVVPGFINLRVSGAFLQSYLTSMRREPSFGVEQEPVPKTIVVDYGGPNVAKPLHIGHLRSAIIGESMKRIYKFFGNHTIGDVHLGDWGLQMGLIITGLQDQQPTWCYFDNSFTGPYPEEAPFTITELESIYPAASARSKEDPAF